MAPRRSPQWPRRPATTSAAALGVAVAKLVGGVAESRPAVWCKGGWLDERVRLAQMRRPRPVRPARVRELWSTTGRIREPRIVARARRGLVDTFWPENLEPGTGTRAALLALSPIPSVAVADTSSSPTRTQFDACRPRRELNSRRRPGRVADELNSLALKCLRPLTPPPLDPERAHRRLLGRPQPPSSRARAPSAASASRRRHAPGGGSRPRRTTSPPRRQVWITRRLPAGFTCSAVATFIARVHDLYARARARQGRDDRPRAARTRASPPTQDRCARTRARVHASARAPGVVRAGSRRRRRCRAPSAAFPSTRSAVPRAREGEGRLGVHSVPRAPTATFHDTTRATSSTAPTARPRLFVTQMAGGGVAVGAAADAADAVAAAAAPAAAGAAAARAARQHDVRARRRRRAPTRAAAARASPVTLARVDSVQHLTDGATCTFLREKFRARRRARVCALRTDRCWYDRRSTLSVSTRRRSATAALAVECIALSVGRAVRRIFGLDDDEDRTTTHAAASTATAHAGKVPAAEDILFLIDAASARKRARRSTCARAYDDGRGRR